MHLSAVVFKFTIGMRCALFWFRGDMVMRLEKDRRCWRLASLHVKLGGMELPSFQRGRGEPYRSLYLSVAFSRERAEDVELDSKENESMANATVALTCELSREWGEFESEELTAFNDTPKAVACELCWKGRG